MEPLHGHEQGFSETADVETASDEYACRFAGAVGAWFLQVQQTALFSLLATPSGGTVLDVGGGHAQVADPLCRRGYRVTVLGSAPDCARRLQPWIAAGQCEFRVGDVTSLPFPDQSFDAVTCFRLLPHCGRWPRLISELCRVATHEVVVDYPTRRSLNAIAPALFEAKRRIEGNTRAWRLFRDSEIRAAFEQQRFAVTGRRPQFFLPMVLHRTLGRRRVSVALEALCRAVGLTAWLGSPVVARAARRDSVP